MDLALYTRETKLPGPLEGPAGPQEDALVLESFQSATMPDLSLSSPPSLCQLLCVIGQRAGQTQGHLLGPTRKDSIAILGAQLDGTQISNNSRIRQAEAVSGRTLEAWSTMSEHLGMPQTHSFHPDGEKGAVKGFQDRLPCLSAT